MNCQKKYINTNLGLVLCVSCDHHEKQGAEIFCMTELSLQLMMINLRSSVTRHGLLSS